MFGKTVFRGLLAVILLASVPDIWAGDITYNIVDYPVNETDPTSATDTVSGMIITDGTIGPISAANIIGGTFSLTSPSFGITGPASFGDPIGLEATPTQLLLDLGANSSFSISTGTTDESPPGFIGGGSMGASVDYENTPSGGQYYGNAGGDFGTLAFVFPVFDSAPVSTTSGSIGANSSWVIATVPEPSTLAMLGGRNRYGRHDRRASPSPMPLFWYEPVPSAALPLMPDLSARTADIWKDAAPKK